MCQPSRFWIKIITVVLVMLLLVPVLAACGDDDDDDVTTTQGTQAPTATPAQLPEKDLKIGVLMPMTGNYAAYGVPMKKVLEMQQDLLNQAGGVIAEGARYKVQLIVEDDQFSPEVAITAVEKLLSRDKVNYIIGPSNTEAAIAVLPILQNAGVFTITTGSVGVLKPEWPLSFREIQPGEISHEIFYEWLNKNHPEIKRVAHIGTDRTAGQEGKVRVQGYCKKYGMELVFSRLYPAATQDFYPIINACLQENPQIIDLIGAAGTTAQGLVLKQLRELGYKGLTVFPHMIVPASVIKIAGAEAAEGYLACSPSPMGDSKYIPPSLKDFAEAYTKRYGAWDSSVLAWANSIGIIAKGVELANSTDPVKVAKALKTADPSKIPCVMGKGKWVGKQFWGIDNQWGFPIQIAQIQQGQLVAIGLVDLPGGL